MSMKDGNTSTPKAWDVEFWGDEYDPMNPNEDQYEANIERLIFDDLTAKARELFAKGDVENGLVVLAGLFDYPGAPGADALKGYIASDEAQEFMDYFGIPGTVEELRESASGDITELPDNGDLPPSDEIDNTPPDYGVDRAGEPLSENAFNWILSRGGEDLNNNNKIDPDELEAWWALQDGQPADDGNLPPSEEIDNPPRIIESDLANDDALRDLLEQLELDELDLSITGILGAIFGANLATALENDGLIDEVLDLFGATRADYDQENEKPPETEEPTPEEPTPTEEPTPEEPTPEEPTPAEEPTPEEPTPAEEPTPRDNGMPDWL